MIPTLLLITSLQTGAVQIMSFDDPFGCYNYVQRNQNQNKYTLECVPAGSAITNTVTQNFHHVGRIVFILDKLSRKLTDE